MSGEIIPGSELTGLGPAVARLSSDRSQFWDGDDWGWRALWLNADQAIERAGTCFDVNVQSAHLLDGGCLNQTWLLRCPDLDRVLRVGRPERSLEQVSYEQTLSRTWASQVPQVISAEAVAADLTPGREHRHVLSLFPFCPGVSGTAVAATLRVERIAPAMATMHQTAQHLNLPQRPGMTSVDDEPVGPRWSAIRTAVEDRFGHGRDVELPADVVDRAVEQVDGRVQGWRAAGRLEPRAAVHGDLNARNQIYRGDQLVGIIDADDCRVEPLIWEVAGLAYSDPTVAPDAVWELYLQAGGVLPATDRDLLLPLARLGALGELQWITDETGAATHLALQNLHALAEDLGGPPTRG